LGNILSIAMIALSVKTYYNKTEK